MGDQWSAYRSPLRPSALRKGQGSCGSRGLSTPFSLPLFPGEDSLCTESSTPALLRACLAQSPPWEYEREQGGWGWEGWARGGVGLRQASLCEAWYAFQNLRRDLYPDAAVAPVQTLPCHPPLGPQVASSSSLEIPGKWQMSYLLWFPSHSFQSLP